MSETRSDELLLDHEYDGIQELDNRLPGWWLWLFYLSIIFGVIYLAYFEVFRVGPGQEAAYTQEVAAAHAAGLGIHYESWGPEVAPADDLALLAEGQTIFTNQCAVCHGPEGQGVIGPNMTDDYFLHGPGFADHIHVIEEGVPEKGMISWKTQLTRDQILAVGTHVFRLRGTEPPNPKAPEGDLDPAVAAGTEEGATIGEGAAGDGDPGEPSADETAE